MGATFSATEYTKQIASFNSSELGHTNDEEINLFLGMSSDFYNVFASSTLEDYRQLKKKKPENLIYLISQVRRPTRVNFLGDKGYTRCSRVANSNRDRSPEHKSAPRCDPLSEQDTATHIWRQRVLHETDVAWASLLRKSDKRNKDYGSYISPPIQTRLHYSTFFRYTNTATVLR